MAARKQSLVAPTALCLLLGITLFYGCRAFDPEPVIINRPPETWIIGAPAETTGGSFQRHLYWFGSDQDGQVVQFIYAITDSSVQDPNDGSGVDEEDARFNPYQDITTVTEPQGVVGWTTKTDSVFTFTVDRGATTSKDITFHIVAVDDRGAMDRTPARLHFVDNSLGNPALRFSVYIDEGPGGSSPPEWKLHWVGDPEGADPAVSPENSPRPFIGFARRFRVTWEGSSPNGPIVGYRYKAEQGDRPYIPGLVEGKKQWDGSLTEFVYNNDQPPSTLSAACDSVTAVGCPPAELRFSSGNYVLAVEALDAALVETRPGLGELRFEINYPPETHIIRGDDGTGEVWPRFQLRDENWNLISEQPFSPGDTIPTGAYVEFRSTGFDRVPSLVGAEFDSFCCDKVLNPNAPEVRFQTRLQFRGFNGSRSVRFANVFQPEPDLSDSIGFVSGPFDYDVISRSVDEHRRPDAMPDTLRFVSGYPPHVTSVEPAAGDSVILRNPISAQPWPQNDYPYEVGPTIKMYWDGRQYLDRQDDPPTRLEVQGNVFTIRPRFEAQPDPREARSSVRAWTYSVQSVNDPENVVTDGLGESLDLSAYTSVPTDNLWDFSSEEGFKIFIPTVIWFNPDLYTPGTATDQDAAILAQGAYLRQRLGEFTLRVQARNTRLGDEYLLYRDTRPGPEAVVSAPIDIAPLGRRSGVKEVKYEFLLGIENNFSGNLDRLWPDF